MTALSVPQFGTEHVTVQVTPFVVVSLVSVAVNACALPSSTVALPGEIATVTGALPPPPQPENITPSARIIVARIFILELIDTPTFVS